MSRPNRWGQRPPKEPASIGDNHVDSAGIEINRLMQKAVTVLTEYNPTREKTIEMLFTDSQIARSCNARGLVTPSGYCRSYSIHGATLSIDYNEALCLPIDESAMMMQTNLIPPLLAFIRDVKAIYYQYEEVKACLRWLNRNATAGAVRFYWPTVLKLCPNAPSMAALQGVPSRYAEPHGIGDRLQMLRDTATTMAGAAMLPTDAEVRVRNKMWLTFQARVVEREGYSFTTDSLTFNI